MDLGREQKPLEPPASPKSEKKIVYPSFDIRDETAEEFGKEYDCDVGDELTAKVKLRVSGIQSDEYGKRKTFEVLSIDDVVETSDKDNEEEAEGSDEEKVLGYKRSPKPEAPDTSAAEIEE